MNDPGPRGSSWFRNGCLGCAGVLALLVVGFLTLLSLGRDAARSQQIARESVEEPLPTATPGPEAASGGAEAVAGGSEAGRDAPVLAVPDFSPEPGAGSGVQAGRVLIDLRQGEFHVEPAPPGAPLRVEAEFDQNRYELVTRRDEDDAGWSYEVRFRQTGDGLVSFLAQLMGADSPRVTVFLPRDVPMDLELRLAQGGGEVDLGGLWLTDARVSFTQGGGALQFSEPLREPTGSLAIDASMGGGAFRRLGNASPRTLRVSTQMGGGDVDLRGEWQRDAEVSLSSRMGGMNVRLPDGVITHGLPRDRSAPEGAEAAEVPTLRFSYSKQMGDIQFR